MKYNEAIDMILYGGKACNDDDESIVYYFHKRAGNLIFSEIDKKQLRRTTDYGYGMEAVLTRKKIDANWIVEKDGVVYEKYPCTSPKYEQPKQASIDEDWLEKKMLCVMQKIILAADSLTDEVLSFDEITRVRPEDLGDLENMDCGHEDCPFCFPREQPKFDHIPDVSKMIDEQFLEDHLGKMPENNHSENVREKVTYVSLDSDLSSLFRALDQTKNMGLHKIYREEWQVIFEERRKIFLKKLEYLVSLQEK